jgi:hypothetical protein
MPSGLLTDRDGAASPRARDPERRGAWESLPRFETVVLAVYALLISVVSAFHEPWKDETQAWRLAIDSTGLAELVRNARYEGHPLLFHVLLQAVGMLSRSWWAVVALHVVVACIAAWIVLRYAPFTRLQKVLLVFGYWSAYEYSVVVRPYGLGMMLAFAACVAWLHPRRRVVWTIVCLLLLANTTAMGTLLAMALTAAFAFDWAWPDDVARRPAARTLATVGVAALVGTLVVLYIVVAQILPPADAAYQGETRTALSLWDVASLPTFELRALFPIVLANEEGVQWSRWVLKPDSRHDLSLVLCLSLIMLAIGLVIAARRRVALVFYLVGTIGFLVFFTFLIPGTAHHHGYLFIVWVVTAWMAWGAAPSERPRLLRQLTDGVEPMRGNLFLISLIPPMIATAEHVIGEIRMPFADAMHAADVIRGHGLADAPLIAVPRSDAQAVGAFLDRPVLFPLEGKTRTFVYWGPRWTHSATVRAADSAATALLGVHCRVVLIASRAKDVDARTAARARLLYNSPRRPMSGDWYRVWVLSAPPSAKCPSERYPSIPPSTPRPVPTS